MNVKPQDLIDLTRSVNNKQKETKLTSQIHTYTYILAYSTSTKIGSYSSHNLIDINTTTRRYPIFPNTLVNIVSFLKLIFHFINFNSERVLRNSHIDSNIIIPQM